MRRPLAISVGDPSGVGPQVSIDALVKRNQSEGVLFGDAEMLSETGRLTGLKTKVVPSAQHAKEGYVSIVDVGRASDSVRRAFAPSAQGGALQLRGLDAAIAAVRSGACRALVTGPTSKEAIVASGSPFVGQTEHCARAAGLQDDDVTMMFLGRLRVALVTTHLSIRDVPNAITKARVARAIRHMAEALARLRPAQTSSLCVAGLNPHAGENGLFGDEERRVLAPAIDEVTGDPTFQQYGVRICGILPAETAFRDAARGAIDGVVAMMHDQATIPSKLLDFGHAVNVTWGLPFVRTSVDHGVAYAAARSGGADASGMIAALEMADRLTEVAS